MTKIIEFVITIALLFFISDLCIKLWKRADLLLVMGRLAKLDGIEIKHCANPFLSLILITQSPEYIINIYGKTYLVRTYNGGGASRSVHFASGKFSVRYSRMRSYYYRPGVGRVVRTKGFNLGASVKIVPDIIVPTELLNKEFTEILIFNPAPTEVSFVVEEKNSIRAAFTGDEVYGRRIFTASTFEIFADREARSIRLENEAMK